MDILHAAWYAQNSSRGAAPRVNQSIKCGTTIARIGGADNGVCGDVGLQGLLEVESSRGLLLTSTRGTIKLLFLKATCSPLFSIRGTSNSIHYFHLKFDSTKFPTTSKSNLARIFQQPEFKAPNSESNRECRSPGNLILHSQELTFLQALSTHRRNRHWTLGSKTVLHIRPHLIKRWTDPQLPQWRSIRRRTTL
jgi:hypothetical protein